MPRSTTSEEVVETAEATTEDAHSYPQMREDLAEATTEDVADEDSHPHLSH